MTETPTKVITTIVGIIITVLIVSFIFNIWNQQKTSGNKAMAQVEQISANMDEADVTQYDGEIVTGSQVLGAIKTLEGKEVSIVVVQGVGSASYTYNYTASADTITASADTITAKSATDRTNDYKAAKSKTSSQYITPSARYTGSITRSKATGAITTLTFTKED